MATPELLRLWTNIRAHLEAARNCLPDRGSMEVQEWLDHNELGLALDDLEAIGMGSNPGPAFWEAMAAAADLMEAPDRATKMRARLTSMG